MSVSIIIPVFNVEKYLERCLKSVKEQTYKDLEIILVDDGSTDKSGIICDDFALKDKRAVVIHKENSGLSSARNAGMMVATGEYVTFLDSDDYLATNFIERTIDICINYKAQIAIMDMKFIRENENAYLKENSDGNIIEMDSEKAIEASLYQKHFSCCAPSKLYNRKVISKISFPVGFLSEDLATCHLFLDKADKIIFINEIGYYYRQRDNSIMHDFNIKRMDALKWAKEIESYCVNNYPNIINASKCRTFNVAIHLLLDLPDKGDIHNDLAPILWQEIRHTRKSVILNNNCRKIEKIAAVISFFGEKALKTIWNSRFAKRKDK